MTALVILLFLVGLVVVGMVDMLRHDRPRTPPVSHTGWGDPRLPSRPYSDGV